MAISLVRGNPLHGSVIYSIGRLHSVNYCNPREDAEGLSREYALRIPSVSFLDTSNEVIRFKSYPAACKTNVNTCIY